MGLGRNVFAELLCFPRVRHRRDVAFLVLCNGLGQVRILGCGFVFRDFVQGVHRVVDHGIQVAVKGLNDKA